MTKHSDRARKNSREGIEIRIFNVKNNIASLKKQKTFYEKLARSGNSFARKSLVGINRNLADRNAQLKRYISRKNRWIKEGKI